MLEILSPAGSPEGIIAAVQSGADAVYMGFGGFNARQGAKNFTDEEFADAVRYCRVRGCKVYVTLNTLASDRELRAASELAVRAADIGADAILVQDLGLARVLRSLLPDMPLHASTQMSVHNLDGVLAAAELGMKRVVLARELNMKQIEAICARSPVEIEVFVHGALCFCHSGQCYMSALIGGHSGNRGMCAQTCRMDYSLGGRMDNKPMSLKDNCLLRYVEELERIGVACAKIEGRAKRPEYAAVVTEIYANAVKNKKAPTQADMDRLTLAFSRQGFTDGYFTGKVGPDMFGVREEPDRGAMERMFAEAHRSYINSELRRVPVKFYAVVEAGKRARFAVEDMDGNHATAEGSVPQAAAARELTGQAVGEQLYKTGGTPYSGVEINCKVDPGLYLPASALNEMRRELISRLTAMRKNPPQRTLGDFPTAPLSGAASGAPRLIYQVTRPEQLSPELAATRPNYLYVPLEMLGSDESARRIAPFIQEGAAVAAVLPRVITDTESETVRQLLHRAKSLGITEVVVGNLGHIAICRQLGFAVRGDFGLNAYNSHALEMLRCAGLISATASFELRLSQIRDMIKPLDTEMIVYGRLPAMVSDQCIIKNSAGRCNCENNPQLADRRGSVFPVIREFGCRNVVLNAHRLYLADKRGDYESIGLWGARLLFTTESARECVLTAQAYMGQTDYSATNITRGLYYRGVK
ncbi:MAG: DUF3656 domain-containing U32 family peptidase [Candidatus Heteroscillospira sp.]|jgi:putative protease